MWFVQFEVAAGVKAHTGGGTAIIPYSQGDALRHGAAGQEDCGFHAQ
jgi:hypothetical protein